MSDKAPNPKPASTDKQSHSPDVQDKSKLAAADQKSEARQKLSLESQKSQKDKNSTPKETAPESNGDRLKGAVKDLHDAVHQRAWGGLGGAEPNVDKIQNILETLSPANRKQVEKLYDQQYGKMGGNLRKDLNAAFQNKETSDSINIQRKLDQPEGVADIAGQIKWASACIKEGKNDKRAMEKVIIDAVSMCDSKEIKQLGLDEQLRKNPHISTETRQALQLLSQGKDKLYDDKGHMKNNIVHVLSDLALHSDPPRLDLYKLALQSADPEYRKTLKHEKAIENAFSGDDAKIAKDYLNKGEVSTLTKVSGDHKEILGLKWWTNKEDISSAMESARNSDESKLYEKGEKLASKYKLGQWLSEHHNAPKSNGEKEALKTFQSLQEKGGASEADRKAFDTYNNLKSELDKAGNPREVKLWEAKLLGSEDIVSKLANCHSDNMIPGLPGSHKAEDLYKAVENLSEKDWKQFRQHPEDLVRVAQTLGTFASQEELNKVMGMLRQKINIKDKDWTYGESKQVGARGAAEVFEQNKANPFEEFWQHNKEKPIAKLEKLMNLTDAERRAYRDTNSPFHKRVNELVKTQLDKGLEQDLAKRILDKVTHNQPVDAIDKVILGELKGDDLKTTINNIENAYKQNPTSKDSQALLERLKHPQTAEDKKIKSYFEAALYNAVDRSGLGWHSRGKDNYEPSHYPEFAKPLFEKGYLPIAQKLQLANSKQERLQMLTNASKSEQASLLAQNPNAETKTIQDLVLGKGDERQFLKNVLQQSIQGKPMTAADECRAFVLGYGDKDVDKLASKIKGLSDEDKQRLANEYYTKYSNQVGNEHSGGQVADDVIQHVKESERRSMREVFAEFPVPSKQTVLNADANRAERREDRWDATKSSADESVEQLLKFVREHKGEIDPKAEAEFLKKVEDYRKAEKAYVESGGKESEALVNATITALSLGAMLIPGAQGITAARLAAFAASGGAFRVAAMKCMQGKDFDGSAHNILEQVFHGSTDAVLCFAGPEMLGMKVGSNAVKVALKTGLEEAGLAGAKFGSGVEAALTRQLDNASCKDALLGSKAVRENIEQALRDNALHGTTEKEIQEATNAYMNQLKKETAAKVLANEAKQAGVNVGTGYVSSAGAQLATDLAFPPQEGLTPEQVFNRCLEAGQSGAAGGALFHFGFKGLGAAYHGAKGTIGKVVDAAGKDKYFASNGTVIEHADGTRTITGNDRTFFKPGDKIVPPTKAPEAQHPSKEAQDITRYMADTGEVRRAIPDGYTDVGPNQRMNPDGSISAARGATTYDAPHDAVLQQFKADAKTYMDRFKEQHPHATKDEQMRELMDWEKRRLGKQTTTQEKQYTSFMSESGGKRISVGELIDRGHLGCSERAHLLKIIADENIGEGYARIVRGDGTGAKKSNHVWNAAGEGKDATIWDASRSKDKLSKTQAGDKYVAESHLPGYGHGVKDGQIRPGEPVEGSPGWKYAKDQPKDKTLVTVVHDALTALSTKDKQAFARFKEANPELAKTGLQVGKIVKAHGPDGKLQDGYQIRHINKETGEIELVKPDGIKRTIPKEQLHRHLPALEGIHQSSVKSADQIVQGLRESLDTILDDSKLLYEKIKSDPAFADKAMSNDAINDAWIYVEHLYSREKHDPHITPRRYLEGLKHFEQACEEKELPEMQKLCTKLQDDVNSLLDQITLIEKDPTQRDKCRQALLDLEGVLPYQTKGKPSAANALNTLNSTAKRHYDYAQRIDSKLVVYRDPATKKGPIEEYEHAVKPNDDQKADLRKLVTMIKWQNWKGTHDMGKAQRSLAEGDTITYDQGRPREVTDADLLVFQQSTYKLNPDVNDIGNLTITDKDGNSHTLNLLDIHVGDQRAMIAVEFSTNPDQKPTQVTLLRIMRHGLTGEFDYDAVQKTSQSKKIWAKKFAREAEKAYGGSGNTATGKIK